MFLGQFHVKDFVGITFPDKGFGTPCVMLYHKDEIYDHVLYHFDQLKRTFFPFSLHLIHHNWPISKN